MKAIEKQASLPF